MTYPSPMPVIKSTHNPIHPETSLALAMFLLPLAAFAADSISVPSPSVKDGSLNAYTLAWADEFNGPALDTEKWGFRTDSKMWSTQKPENVEVSGGTLTPEEFRIDLR